MLANLRNEIDLTNPNKTVAKCAAKAYIGQFQYFGVEYMGECWSGPDGNLTYKKFGPSSQCLNGLGGDESLSVYRFKEPRKSHEGKWQQVILLLKGIGSNLFYRVVWKNS